MKKYLVTGGFGFIGSNFIIKLYEKEIAIDHNFEIHCIDNLTYAANLENIPIEIRESSNFIHFNFDIASEEVVKIIQSNYYEFGVNFAAESHVDRSILGSDVFVRTNVAGVNNLLNGWKQYQTQRFIQIGTDEVYGSVAKGSTNELTILDPSSPYSATKASADLLALAFRRTHNLDVVVTRCCNNYGPRQHKEKLIPKLMDATLNNSELLIYGDGTNIREWIYVDDHVEALFKIIKAPTLRYQIYNIGSGVEYTNNSIAKEIINKFGTASTKTRYVQDRPGHDFRYSLDFSRIQSELGYFPITNFEKGLEETFKWFSELKLI